MRRVWSSLVLAIALAFALPAVAYATPVFVSVLGSDTLGDGSALSPYATVQYAIDSLQGDEIYVGPGTFVGDIEMREFISVYGAGPDSTIIQGTGLDSVVTFWILNSGETLSGVTLTGGAATRGGGIYCYLSSPVIEDVRITDNHAFDGGGLLCLGATPTVTGCVVTGNVASRNGGGICLMSSSAVVVNSVVAENSASRGGGIWSSGGSVIVNDTVVFNTAGIGGGILTADSALPVTNCIVWANGVDVAGCTPTYSDVGVGPAGTGSFSADPAFVDADADDYHLSPGSPCIDVATSTVAPADDLDGVFRPLGLGCDMGAYEIYDPAHAEPVDPTLTSVTHGEGVWSNDASVTVDLADAHGVVAPLAGYAVSVSTEATESPQHTVTHALETTSVAFEALVDGVYHVNVASVDAIGNWSVGTHYGPILIDRTPPIVSITPEVSSVVGASVFALQANDARSGVGAVYCVVDGAAPTMADSVRIDTAGEHTIAYWAIDNAGNESAHHVHEVTMTPAVVSHVQVAGIDRYATAVEASKRGFPQGAEAVVIATGENWPDALGGTALAGVHDAPVLLTRGAALPAVVAGELRRLDPDHVFVLGGLGAVSSNVEGQIGALLGSGTDIERFSGSDRFGTARAIAARAAGDSHVFDGTVYVATGLSFPDALAAAPLATAFERPLYLAGPSGLSEATVEAMWFAGVTDVVILGGTNAVSADVEAQLAPLSIACSRLSGIDRYATALDIAESGVAGGLTWDKVALACGATFPDALSGGVMQGHDSSVMVLTPRDSLDADVKTALDDNRDTIAEVRYLGGTNAITQSVRDEVAQTLR